MEHMECKSKPILLWTASVVVGCLVLSMPFFDTSLQFNLRECIGDGSYQRLSACIIAVSFGLEYLFLRAKKWTTLKWIPVVFPAVCLIIGELFWLSGGWDRIASVILWWFGFPMLIGAAVAVFLRHLPENRRIRMLIVIAVVAVVVLSVVFWPSTLSEQMTLNLGDEMLLYDTDGTKERLSLRDPNGVEQMLHFAELVYAPVAPDWDARQGILLRLNAEYVVAAQYGEDPYIYAHSGALEAFDGSSVRWRFYYFPALYTELRGLAESTAEETFP